MLILPTKFFEQLSLALPNVAIRCTDLQWNLQNRQAVIRVDFFTNIIAAETEGATPLATEYIRIDNYDSVLIEQLAEGWLSTQPSFSQIETVDQYNARLAEEAQTPEAPADPESDGYLN
jgi:hypothetical protein